MPCDTPEEALAVVQRVMVGIANEVHQATIKLDVAWHFDLVAFASKQPRHRVNLDDCVRYQAQNPFRRWPFVDCFTGWIVLLDCTDNFAKSSSTINQAVTWEDARVSCVVEEPMLAGVPVNKHECMLHV